MREGVRGGVVGERGSVVEGWALGPSGNPLKSSGVNDLE